VEGLAEQGKLDADIWRLTGLLYGGHPGAQPLTNLVRAYRAQAEEIEGLRSDIEQARASLNGEANARIAAEDALRSETVYGRNSLNRALAAEAALAKVQAESAEVVALRAVAKAARDVSLAMTQDEAGRWIINGDGEVMAGELYDALEAALRASTDPDPATAQKVRP
jgi:hypothetical protein